MAFSWRRFKSRRGPNRWIDAHQAATRNAIEQKRYAFSKDSIAPQLAVKEAEVERLRDMAKLRRDELEALTVRAGMNGILQILPVEVGAQVQPGSNLARVARSLKWIRATVSLPAK